MTVALATSAYLYLSGVFSSFASALRFGVFQTISISTNTGYTTTGYQTWHGGC